MPTRGFIFPGYGVPQQGPPGPQGEQGIQGEIGPIGPAGGNEVTEASTTTFTGLLKGDGANVGVATPDVEYATPAALAAHAGNTNNPHGVTYDETGAAPLEHQHSVSEVTGAAAAVDLTGHINASNPHGITASGLGAALAADLTAHTGATNPHGVTPAVIGAARVLNSIATVLAGSWVGAAAPYTQNVAIAGITSSMHPRIDISDTATTAAEWDAIEAAFLCVHRVSSYDGGITLKCWHDKPTVSFAITVEVAY